MAVFLGMEAIWVVVTLVMNQMLMVSIRSWAFGSIEMSSGKWLATPLLGLRAELGKQRLVNQVDGV